MSDLLLHIESETTAEIDATEGKTVVSVGVVGNNRVMTIPVSGILGRERLSRPIARRFIIPTIMKIEYALFPNAKHLINHAMGQPRR